MEDIGPANLPLVVSVLEIVHKNERKPEELASMIQALCASPHTRMMSHLWKAYATEKGVKLAREKGIEVDDGLTEKDKKYLLEVKIRILWKDSDPEVIKVSAEMFRKRLMDEDMNCVKWLSELIKVGEKVKVAPRNRKTNPMVIIWEILKSYLHPRAHNVLMLMYFKTTDKDNKRPYLMTAVLSALYRTEYTPYDLGELTQKWKVSPVLHTFLQSQYKLEMDFFVYDKHTAIGRSRKATAKEWVLEGALVAHQDPMYYDKVLDEIYIEVQ